MLLRSWIKSNTINYYLYAALLCVTTITYGAPTLDSKDIEFGKIMYLKGILPSGKNMSATMRGDITITGDQAACVNCHRRSGLGTTEGQTIVMDITSPTLFSDIALKARRYLRSDSTDASLERPAYTRDLLKQAVVHGIRSNGKPLNKTMPRYSLEDGDFNSLFAYLTTLSSKPSEGVTDRVFHIATIIDTSAPDDEIQEMQQIISQYLDEYNAETRYESKRVKHAPIQKEWHYETYRKIQHHLWKLDADMNNWKSQLDQYYASQPVFAVIGGLSHRSWNAVDVFCNEYTLPCIFPTVDHPDASPDNYYSLYYSRGAALEADVLAKYLHEQALNKPMHILLLTDGANTSEKAAHIIMQNLSLNSNITLDNKLVTSNTSLEGVFTSVNGKPYDSIILSLQGNQISKLIKSQTGRENPNKTSYYAFSNVRFDDSIIDTIRQAGVDFFIVSPYVDKKKQKRKMLRASVWAKSRKLDISSSRVLSETFTAFMITGNALRHLRGNYYRDYLLELLEHKVERAVVSALYPRLTIGPGQRYAAKACRIEKVGDTLEAITPWIVP